jgi:hypothetical protein
MSNINDKAWKLLSEDEQLAVTLKYGHNKSTWEAGEIMNKSHYKFLEIEARGKKFLQLFTEHYEFYETLIPPYIKMDIRVRKYFRATIEKRLKPKEIVEDLDDTIFNIKSMREELISKEIEKLVNSKSAVDKNLANVILDFDRWNNYRILPSDIQEPSAFKRRNKNNDKNNIKHLTSMNTFTVEKIVERYKFEAKSNNSKELFVPIFSRFIIPEESILPIRNDNDIIKELSKIGFFIFTNMEHAQNLYNLIYNYDINQKKSCKEGQKFWPKYRLITRRAINHNMIRKRIASRKFLESALKDMDLNYLNPKDRDSNNPRRKRRKNIDLGLDK